jgi:NADPH2:quinone reductase
VAGAVRALTDGVGVAVAYDSVGRTTFDASLAALRRRGTLVLCGASSGPVPPFDPQRLNAGRLGVPHPAEAVRLHRHARRAARARLSRLRRRPTGRSTCGSGHRYPLAEAAAAHTDLQARRTTGKVLLVP